VRDESESGFRASEGLNSAWGTRLVKTEDWRIWCWYDSVADYPTGSQVGGVVCRTGDGQGSYRGGLSSGGVGPGGMNLAGGKNVF